MIITTIIKFFIALYREKNACEKNLLRIGMSVLSKKDNVLTTEEFMYYINYGLWKKDGLVSNDMEKFAFLTEHPECIEEYNNQELFAVPFSHIQKKVKRHKRFDAFIDSMAY